MHIPYNFFETLRDNIIISDVVKQKISLTKKGQEYLGICPFHSEKTPSFTVNDAKKFYHCFGCGAHGDVIKFIVETGGFSYSEAAKKLATDYGIPIPQSSKAQEKIYEETENILLALSAANDFFLSQLTNEAKNYLASRRLDNAAIEKYSVGYAPSGKALVEYLESKNFSLPVIYNAGLIGKNDSGEIYQVFRNRITFPIKNIYGKIIAFGARILGEGLPKYLNSPESLVFKKSETLYGEDIATGAAYRAKRIIVVEGYLDTIAMQKAGFLETVATLGTAVTASHLNKLWRIADEIIFCLDGDEAGQKAMQKAIILILPLLKLQRKVSFIILPDKLDPDDIIDKYGVKYLDDLINNRLPTSSMIWYLETHNKTFTTPEAKSVLESKLNEYTGLVTNNSFAHYMNLEFKNKIWELTRFKSNKKNAKPVAQITNLPNNMNAAELIEYNLITLILKHSDLLDDETIYNQLIYLNIKNESLDKIRLSIIELHNEKSDTQKSGFLDLFVLLSSSKSAVLDILSLDNNNLDSKLLWILFIKKYQLELLKEEYAKLIHSKEEGMFDKAQSYLKEIAKAEFEIKEINENLTS